jgi:hypothetical protein
MEVLTATAPSRRMRHLAIAVALAAAALFASLAGASSASAAVSCDLTQPISTATGNCIFNVAGTFSYTIPLSAATQTATGVPGDGNATGTSNVTMNADTNQVCATTTWSGVSSPVVWGHIHLGAYGQPENPAVTTEIIPANFLNGNPSGVSECSTAPPGEIGAIVRCKGQFNIVVHSQAHPVGAIRGQFGSGGCAIPL